jgi:hypothetical protein
MIICARIPIIVAEALFAAEQMPVSPWRGRTKP